MLPSASELGSKWVNIDVWRNSYSPEEKEDATGIYGGSDGTRIFIVLYALPLSFADRAWDWEKIRTTVWQAWIDTYLIPPEFEDSPLRSDVIKVSSAILPDDIGSGFAYRTMSQDWGQPTLMGLFEVTSGPALIIVIDGSYEEVQTLRTLTRVAAIVVGND